MKKLLAGLALASALVLTGAGATGLQYWNPEKITSLETVSAIA
ncbi:hypothetical protein [Amycolatopsis sp. FBCC-B4732]|nr:hypothetical protein [Amycolatopsis sp. FBCC-B4732]